MGAHEGVRKTFNQDRARVTSPQGGQEDPDHVRSTQSLKLKPQRNNATTKAKITKYLDFARSFGFSSPTKTDDLV